MGQDNPGLVRITGAVSISEFALSKSNGKFRNGGRKSEIGYYHRALEALPGRIGDITPYKDAGLLVRPQIKDIVMNHGRSSK